MNHSAKKDQVQTKRQSQLSEFRSLRLHDVTLWNLGTSAPVVPSIWLVELISEMAFNKNTEHAEEERETGGKIRTPSRCDEVESLLEQRLTKGLNSCNFLFPLTYRHLVWVLLKHMPVVQMKSYDALLKGSFEKFPWFALSHVLLRLFCFLFYFTKDAENVSESCSLYKHWQKIRLLIFDVFPNNRNDTRKTCTVTILHRTTTQKYSSEVSTPV